MLNRRKVGGGIEWWEEFLMSEPNCFIGSEFVGTPHRNEHKKTLYTFVYIGCIWVLEACWFYI